MTINTGLYYKRSYESDWNAIRRFYLSNPIYSPKKLKDELLRHISENYPDVCTERMTKKDLILEANYPGLKPYHLFNSSFNISGNPIVTRICPECERQIFHSYIFEFSWMKFCPIHGIGLKRPTDIKKDQITGNGIVSAYMVQSKTSRLSASEFEHMDTEPFNYIYKAIFNRTTDFHDHLLSEYYGYNRIYDIDIFHELYPSFVQGLSDFEKDTLKTYGVNFTDINELCGDIWKNQYYDKIARAGRNRLAKKYWDLRVPEIESPEYLTDPWARNIRRQVISAASTSIRKACPEKHRLSLCSRCHPRNYKKTCPYCLSFTIWFFKILTNQHLYKINGVNCQDAIYSDFSRCEPLPVQTYPPILYKHDIYDLPHEIQEVLYERSIEYLLYSIYSYVKHVISYFLYTDEGITEKTVTDCVLDVPDPGRNSEFKGYLLDPSPYYKITLHYPDNENFYLFLNDKSQELANLCRTGYRDGGLRFPGKHLIVNEPFREEAIKLMEEFDLTDFDPIYYS